MAKAETEPTKTAGADCESACQDSLSLPTAAYFANYYQHALVRLAVLSRFTPESRHSAVQRQCPLWANSRHLQAACCDRSAVGFQGKTYRTLNLDRTACRVYEPSAGIAGSRQFQDGPRPSSAHSPRAYAGRSSAKMNMVAVGRVVLTRREHHRWSSLGPFRTSTAADRPPRGP